jgi:hypothetical protein
MRECDLEIVRAAALKQRIAGAGAIHTSSTDILLRAASRAESETASTSTSLAERLRKLALVLGAFLPQL